MSHCINISVQRPMANSTEHVTNIQAASAHYNVSARPMEDWNFNVVVMAGS